MALKIGLRDADPGPKNSRLAQLQAERTARRQQERIDKQNRSSGRSGRNNTGNTSPPPPPGPGLRSGRAGSGGGTTRRQGVLSRNKGKIAAGAAVGGAIALTGGDDEPENQSENVVNQAAGLRRPLPTLEKTLTGEPIERGANPQDLVNKGAGFVQKSGGLRRVVADRGDSSSASAAESASEITGVEDFRRGGRGIFSSLYDSGRLQGIRNRQAGNRDRAAAASAAAVEAGFKDRELKINAAKNSVERDKLIREHSNTTLENISSDNPALVSAEKTRAYKGVIEGNDPGGIGSSLLAAEIAATATVGNAIFDAFPDFATAARLFVSGAPPFELQDLELGNDGEIRVGGQEIAEINDLSTEAQNALNQFIAKTNRAKKGLRQ